MKNKILSVLFAVSLFFLILSFSIGLPIYCRPFYYAHIDRMELSAKSGFSREEIVDAYNEVLDYLTIPGVPFGTGVMRHSAEGAAHFADCKVLFDLNAAILLLSAVTVTLILVLYKRKKVESLRLGRFSASFYAAVAAITIPLFVGFLASRDFDRAFTVFHEIFFPGKDNWTFYPNQDQIIQVMPQEFFRNCAILIGAGILVLSLTLIIIDLVRTIKYKTKNAP